MNHSPNQNWRTLTRAQVPPWAVTQDSPRGLWKLPGSHGNALVLVFDKCPGWHEILPPITSQEEQVKGDRGDERWRCLQSLS